MLPLSWNLGWLLGPDNPASSRISPAVRSCWALERAGGVDLTPGRGKELEDCQVLSLKMALVSPRNALGVPWSAASSSDARSLEVILNLLPGVVAVSEVPFVLSTRVPSLISWLER